MADHDVERESDGSSLGDDWEESGPGPSVDSQIKGPSSSSSAHPMKPLPLQKRRRRNPTPQYIEALEGRLQRLDSFFKTVLPDIDLDQPGFEAETLPKIKQAVKKAISKDTAPASSAATGQSQSSEEALLETMVEATGRLDLDESGRLDFHGHSSGFTYLTKLREQFGDLLGPEVGTNTLLKLRPFRPFPAQTRSNTSSPSSNYISETIPLPPREIAKELTASCLAEALLMFRFIHRPTFDSLVDRLYGRDFDDYGNEEHSFLPVFYFVLAIGCLFTRKARKLGISNVQEEGAKYFAAGRKLTDITDCRDVTSLQSVLLMIIFLQSSAKLATCYSYIGIAVSASFRLGLHRKIPFPDPIEAEVRKRIFCTIQKMDISISALIGLPRMIHDEDIDQEYPTEVDDQYITKDGVTPGIVGEPNTTSAANAHTRLVQILAKVIKKIYPIKGVQTSNRSNRAGYMISYTVVREIEQDLEKWQESLPLYLRRGDDSPPHFLRSQYLLQISLAHVKMMLYRPFIHYVAQPRDGRVRDERPFASAAACINTCREIVHLCQQMKDKEILSGAYWFLIYTTFFSVLSLLYFVLENITHPDAPAVLRDATIGKECIFSLKESSMAGERCSIALKPLFEQLPNRLREGFGKAQTKKRGRAASPALVGTGAQQQPVTEGFTLSENQSPARSNTFPVTTSKSLPGSTMARPSINLPDAARRSSNDSLTFSHEMLSPTHTSDPQDSRHSLQQHLGGFTGMPDLNALMFPASNAFAYGSQAMMFDVPIPGEGSTDPPFGSRDSRGSAESGRHSFGTGSPSFDNVEVQLYGPLPPYVYSIENTNQGFGTTPVTYSGVSGPATVASGSDHNQVMFDNFNQSMSDRAQGQPKLSNQYPVNLDDFLKMGMNDEEWDPIFGNQRSH
ncbi:hypothetical protein H072_3221 [Dactylellina haptotyla CBS 200.50]|uniref:Xylanolytic transcriptional activator regulatory domain-containing protein n=1 Tax=Dactylellina haptotyla (strain CBS 200.50) TaxID=1284197 RepID=S8ANY4_DACHA|nr:hypothetical protein H072_3221 [Dactylellina haptotyla CBS 200.50]